LFALITTIGVIRNGGAQPNIIPEETELEYYLRTPTNAEMEVLKEKVKGCVQAAAMATGCTVSRRNLEPALEDQVVGYIWKLTNMKCSLPS